MPRAIWSGSISFGLVNVPVKLYSATESKDVRFHQFQEGSDRRIHYKRVAEGTDEEVPYEDIVKGYEVSDGRYVMLTPEELESVEPGKTRTIDIEDFVELTEIDPLYFAKSYYLAPDKGGEKAYALLRESMERAKRVAIGRFVMRTKQYLGAIRPAADVLVLETMFFGDEVRDPQMLDLPDAEVSDRELRIADQLIDSLTVPFEPMSYTDTYRERVLELIEAKAEGQEIVLERREDAAEPASDLMAALEASVSSIRAARDRRRERGGDEAGGGAADLTSLSKDELYERASEQDVSGRSKMTKDELIEALREAS